MFYYPLIFAADSLISMTVFTAIVLLQLVHIEGMKSQRLETQPHNEKKLSHGLSCWEVNQ